MHFCHGEYDQVFRLALGEVCHGLVKSESAYFATNASRQLALRLVTDRQRMNVPGDEIRKNNQISNRNAAVQIQVGSSLVE